MFQPDLDFKSNVIDPSQPSISGTSKSAILPNLPLTHARTSTQKPTNARGSLRCPFCDKPFSNSSAIAKHKLTHSEERKYVCSICHKAFKRQDHLNGHKYTHETNKPHACKFCERSYSDARSLRRHYENAHPLEYERWLMLSQANEAELHSGGEKRADELNKSNRTASPYSCSTASNVTSPNTAEHDDSVEDAKVAAMLLAHPLEAPKRVSCSVCQKRFKNRSALNGHMRLHGGYAQATITTATATTTAMTTAAATATSTTASWLAGLVDSEDWWQPNWTQRRASGDGEQQAARTDEARKVETTQSLGSSDLLLRRKPPVPLTLSLPANSSQNTESNRYMVYNETSSSTHHAFSEVAPMHYSPVTPATTQQQQQHESLFPFPPAELMLAGSGSQTSGYANLRASASETSLMQQRWPLRPFLANAEMHPIRRSSGTWHTPALDHVFAKPPPPPPLPLCPFGDDCAPMPIAAVDGFVSSSSTSSSSSALSFSAAEFGSVEHQPQHRERERERHISAPIGTQPPPPSDLSATSDAVADLLMQSHITDPFKLPEKTESCSASSTSTAVPMDLAEIELTALGPAPELPRLTEDALFRNPQPGTAAKKRKPAPISIPLQCGTNLSRLRSPRVWDWCPSPPPYTPPPMLSPNRRAPGLFASLRRSSTSSGPLRRKSGGCELTGRQPLAAKRRLLYQHAGGMQPSPKSAPVLLLRQQQQQQQQSAPSTVFGYDEETMRRFAEEDQAVAETESEPMQVDKAQAEEEYADNEEEEEGLPSSVIPRINIGPAFQAEIPSLCSDALAFETEADRRETLLWYPANLDEKDPKNMESLDLLMKIACSPAVRNCGLNMEYTFHLLCKYEGDLEMTLHALLHDTLVVYDYIYAETTIWTTAEIERFQQALSKYGCDFHQVAELLQSSGTPKTVKACVEFYYVWKHMNTPSEVKRIRNLARRRLRRGDEEDAEETTAMTIGDANPVENNAYNLRRKHQHNHSHSNQEHEVMMMSMGKAEDDRKFLNNFGSDAAMSPFAPGDLAEGLVDDEALFSSTTDSLLQFPCRLCPKVFSKVKSRSAHMKSHSDRANQNR